MYGVGSDQIIWKDNSYNSGYFIWYYSPRNCYLYPGHAALNTGGVRDGQKIDVVIDRYNCKITWSINGS